MVENALGTTNVLLGALVLISVLEAIALAFVVIVALRLYAQMVRILGEVQQQIRPLAERANTLAAAVENITTDVKTATGRAASGAEKAGAAFQTAFDIASLVRGTARASVVSRALPLLGIARGLRVAYRSFVGSRSRPEPGSSTARPPREDHRSQEATLDHSSTTDHNTEAVHGT